MKNGLLISVLILQCVIVAMIYFCVCKTNKSESTYGAYTTEDFTNKEINADQQLSFDKFKEENPGALDGITGDLNIKRTKADVDSSNARTWINNYNNTANGLKLALTEGPGSYLKSVAFSANNGTLSNLSQLFASSTINGLRIYLAKVSTDTSIKDYKIILVGMKDGVDVLTLRNATSGDLSSVQDYGNPCKPICGGEKY